MNTGRSAKRQDETERVPEHERAVKRAGVSKIGHPNVPPCRGLAPPFSLGWNS